MEAAIRAPMLPGNRSPTVFARHRDRKVPRPRRVTTASSALSWIRRSRHPGHAKCNDGTTVT